VLGRGDIGSGVAMLCPSRAKPHLYMNDLESFYPAAWQLGQKENAI
jgi:hypothetical protein